MRRIQYTGLLLLMGLCLVKCKSTSGEKRGAKNSSAPPNIVFIMADDHAYQAISAYGSSLIETPNIDRIANEGALMRQARVTNSICSPSRAVLLTGKYSHKNGMKDNGTYFNTDQPTFPKLLRENGYKTAMIGKWHLFSEPTGFDYWNILPDQGHYYNPEFIKMGKDTVYDGYVTDVITDLSLDWIEKNKSEPFCLMLQHKAPHRNWMPPLKYLNSFNDRKFELPANFYDDYEGRLALERSLTTIQHGHLDVRYDSKIPCDTCKVTKVNSWAPEEWQREIERLTSEEKKKWDEGYKEEYEAFKKLKTEKEFIEWQYQRYMEDYLRCIKSVDDNVGRVLKYLEEEGLAENTIIVYMSDQGFYLGEHGLYDKRFMYQESFRTPMMIRYPDKIAAKQRIDEPTLNLDVAPTFLDYAGIPIPEDMQGKSMRVLMEIKERRPEWRSNVYYHYYEKSFGATAHYGIKTDRYKLIHFYNPINSWELYDLEKDPGEMKNLYGNPEYSVIEDKLMEQLINLQEKYDDKEGLELNNL